LKPYSDTSNRNNNNTKFIIETEQHYNLIKSFRLKQAFYISVKGLAGITAGPGLVPLRSFMKNTNSQHTYFIHLGTDSTAVS